MYITLTLWNEFYRDTSIYTSTMRGIRPHALLTAMRWWLYLNITKTEGRRILCLVCVQWCLGGSVLIGRMPRRKRYALRWPIVGVLLWCYHDRFVMHLWERAIMIWNNCRQYNPRSRTPNLQRLPAMKPLSSFSEKVNYWVVRTRRTLHPSSPRATDNFTLLEWISLWAISWWH
jgi:hypothetical protein